MHIYFSSSLPAYFHLVIGQLLLKKPMLNGVPANRAHPILAMGANIKVN